MNAFKAIRSAFRKRLGDKALTQVTCNYRRMRWKLPPRVVKFRNPIRFTDKVIWLKRNSRFKDAHILADKIAVRDHVRKLVGDECLIPFVGAYSKIEDVNISDLPDKFVIKPNHTSGHVHFGSRDTFSHEEVSKVCNPWLEIDYFQVSREYQYKNISPKLLIEKDMRSVTGAIDLPDYKFFCFNGEPTFVQIDMGRFSNHIRVYYDMDWTKLPFTILYPRSEEELEKPQSFEEMKKMAARLSKGYSFIRVDFYDIKGKAYFGEITFHPDGGHGPFIPDHFDEEYGRLIDLKMAK